jgi:hypothetical protein
MIGSNTLVMLTQRVQDTLADLAAVTSVTGETCGHVKDMADDALKLAKEIEETRKMVKQPHLDASTAVDTAYAPLRDSLEAAARAVKKMVETWVIAEKRKAEAEAEAARKAAEEAAKAQAEEDPFLCDEQLIEQANTTAAIANTRALAARQVVSAAGTSKTSSLRTVRFAEVKDAKALVLHYAEHPDVLGAATKLANAAIRAAKGGPCVIPGVEIKSEEKLV